MNNEFNPLALDNQLCFPLYVCSKEIIRRYTPLLEPLGLTYTSYITLMCLWEQDNISVKELGIRLFLDSGTLTPLLKKMETNGLITRQRGQQDERNVYIRLTDEGRRMEQQCRDIPAKMMCRNVIEPEKAVKLIKELHELMTQIRNEQ